MKKLSLALAFSLLATTALAADLPVRPVGKAPSPRALEQQGGWYLGLGAGYVWGDASALGQSAEPSGYLLSLMLGYDAYYGPHLWRLEGELGVANAKDSTLFGIASGELNGLAMARVGYGYQFANGFTPFAMVGVYGANHTVSIFGVNDTKNHVGLTYGAGAEMPIGREGWKLRGEWIRLAKDNENYSLFGGTINTKFEADIGRLALTKTF